MIELMRSVAGALGFVILVLAPGAWLSFGLPLREAAVLPRVAWAVALSPLVLFAQFHLLSPLGLSFPAATGTLVLINAPALLLAARHLGSADRIELRALLTWMALLAVPAACVFLPMLIWPQYRLFWSHSWMQSDIVYALARGVALRPEEPELAGVALSYPWAGHLYQALLSRSLDSPPMASYGWTNAAFTGAIAIFTAATTAALGGGPRARYCAVVALFFGVNFVGYWLAPGVAAVGLDPGGLFGDWRYTPWLWKFRFFNQMPMALCAFAGVAHLLARREARQLDASELAMLAALLLGLGVAYALLLPAAFLLVLGWLLVAAPPLGDRPPREWMGPWLTAGMVLGATGAMSLAYALFVRQDTVGGLGLGISELSEALDNASSGLFATSPLLLGVYVVWGRVWRGKRLQCRSLLAAGAGSLALYAALDIPYLSNEYKFVFSAAICLAPFAGLAAERALASLRSAALPAVLALSLVLAIPFALKIGEKRAGRILRQPRVDVSSFDIRLASDEPLAAATEAIRSATPPDSVVVAAAADIHLPTLVQRSFYIPPAQRNAHAGGGIISLDILRFPRAHDPAMLGRRVANRNALFGSKDATRRKFSLGKLLSLGRPAVILLEPALHTDLDQWLATQPLADPVHRDARYAVWLLDPAAAHGRSLNAPVP